MEKMNLILTRKETYKFVEVILNGCRSYTVNGDSLEITNEEKYLKATASSYVHFASNDIDSILIVLNNCYNVSEVLYKDKIMSLNEAINFFTKLKEK